MARTALASTLVVLLAACGGGGGGGGGTPPGPSFIVPEVAFSTFADVKGNTTPVMKGISTTASGTYHTDTSGIIIDSVNTPVDDSSSANTIKLTYDGNRALSTMAFATPSASASFAKAGAIAFLCASGVCGAQNATGHGFVIDGTTMPITPTGQWNYQSFGIWDQLGSAGAFQVGAVSAGVVTAGSAVPTSGPNATFAGIANGLWVDASKNAFFTTAPMSATADWTARSISFSTSGTQTVNMNTGTQAANSGLDMTGTLTYAAGTSRFSGPVQTATVVMSGNASGQFYGPAAEEMGGTFKLNGAGGNMIGGFGGRR